MLEKFQIYRWFFKTIAPPDKMMNLHWKLEKLYSYFILKGIKVKILMFYTHACRFESFNFLLFNELKKVFMLPPPDFVSFTFFR